MTPDVLQADPRAKQVEKTLKGAGISDAWWTGLLDRVAHLPTLHDIMSRETVSEAQARRKRLAVKMRDLALALDNDRDASSFHIAGLPRDPTHSLAGLLAECVDSLENLSEKKAILPSFETRQGNSLKTYVVRGVYHWIDFYYSQGRQLGVVDSMRPSNVDTALLASAVLGNDVSANDVTQIRRDERRKYDLG